VAGLAELERLFQPSGSPVKDKDGGNSLDIPPDGGFCAANREQRPIGIEGQCADTAGVLEAVEFEEDAGVDLANGGPRGDVELVDEALEIAGNERLVIGMKGDAQDRIG